MGDELERTKGIVEEMVVNHEDQAIAVAVHQQMRDWCFMYHTTMAQIMNERKKQDDYLHQCILQPYINFLDDKGECRNRCTVCCNRHITPSHFPKPLPPGRKPKNSVYEEIQEKREEKLAQIKEKNKKNPKPKKK